MRVKTLVLSSTSGLMLALAATPAAAQDQPATPSNPAATAQDNPANSDQSAVQTDDAVQSASGADQVAEGDAIVVTGLRASLRSAQGVKRNSDQIVDAIVAEDIGKLPDVAVSDTAARIPGIQVERNGGEASRVLLRGLDERFYATTYNAREIFTAETRSVALQDFPAGGISAIEAFKSSTANLIEPGISGLVNVRSRRPFDFKSGTEVAGSVWGVYPQQSRDFDPNAQLLVSNRWDLPDGGEFGALINFSYTRLHYQDSVRRHGFFIADLAGGRSPDWPEIHYNEGDRWRPSINGALQWRPSPGLEFYLEGLWQGYRANLTDRMWAQPLWGGASYSNIVKEGNNIISGTVNRPTACCGGNQTWGFQGATKRKTDTFQFAVGGSYDAGALRISGDLARTSSTFNLRTESIDYEINTNNYSVDWFTGRPGGSGPTFQVRGIDPTNPAIYNYRGFFEDYATAKGDDWQARLDFEYEPGMDWLSKIDWGVRYVNRDASNRAGAFYWNLRDRGIPISAVPLDYVLYDPAFRGDKHKPFPLTWLSPSFDSVWNRLRPFRQFNINLTGTGSLNGPPTDATRTFAINEKSLAGYAQLHYGFDAGSIRMDGELGIRAVNTREDIQGTYLGAAFNRKNDYTDWLPNWNLRVHFTPELQLRLAASQTRTRPSFTQLNPGANLNSPSNCGGSDCITGTRGNPFLTPQDSNNYDASLEYYFSRAGFASAAVFRRDLKGFIVNQAVTLANPSNPNVPLLLTGPVNLSRGRIQGFEAQFSTFFDFEGLPDWLRSFGVQANVTYLDTKADYSIFPAKYPNGSANPNHAEPTLVLPDVSKWTYNLVGMYEGGGLTLRLAYNRRSSYAEGALDLRDNFFTLQGRGNPVSRLDWSSSYTVNENLTVFFDWTNILGHPFKSDIVRVNYPGGVASAPEIFPMVVRFEESVLSGGIRFRF